LTTTDGVLDERNQSKSNNEKHHMKTKLDSIHPGEVLGEEFLKPMELSAYRLAKDTGLPQSRVSEILSGSRSITAETALRLARYFGTTPEFWINLQSGFDLEQADRKLGKKIEATVKPRELVEV
jgi:addiction module HigA family antidote